MSNLVTLRDYKDVHLFLGYWNHRLKWIWKSFGFASRFILWCVNKITFTIYDQVS